MRADLGIPVHSIFRQVVGQFVDVAVSESGKQCELGWIAEKVLVKVR